VPWILIAGGVILAGLVVLAVYDVTQKRHAILRNFPVIGHLRYWLESIGPELRQYIVTDNDEERPFTRDQRRWVYATSKRENPYFGFGTDNHLEDPDYIIIRHAAFPYNGTEHDPDANHVLPGAKILGEWHDRPGAFRPASLINISGMSYGSLSGPAVESLNRGAALAGCLQNTGEGGVSAFHRNGGDLVWQIGTGYFGCRAPDGGFDMARFEQTLAGAPVRAIEVKLSQGAKPGLGGLLPGAKVTAEIAEARGVPIGLPVHSPSRHRTFDDVAGLVNWVEELAHVSGLPVGIKSAIGETAFWNELAEHMAATGRGPDFVTVDGGEGGTGAAPMVFSDHVALPYRLAMASVYKTFVAHGLHERITFIGSGKLGFPQQALVAMSLGADLINVAREAMMAIGCIQAQRCHTGHCPVGVATQNKWLTRGLDPSLKSVRVASYVDALRGDLLKLSWACGVPHPSLVPPSAILYLESPDRSMALGDRFGYDDAWTPRGAEAVASAEAFLAAAH
jgi:glutamate synthase domain-containing protein 2